MARGLAYAPYADLIWCETSTPDLAEARQFAEGVKAMYPDKMLAYNCSPSFNWKKHLDDETIARFQKELGSMGYVFQFVTLAGWHAINESDLRARPWLRAPGHERLRGPTAARVRPRAGRLHRNPAPTRGRCRLLRRCHVNDHGRLRFDARLVRFDRASPVPRHKPQL